MADSLERIAASIGAPRPSLLGAVFGRWAELVGPDVAAHATPRSLRDGVLTVVVDHPAWATSLRLLSADLLRRIAPHGDATELVVRVDLPGRHPRLPPPESPPPRRRAQTPPPEAAPPRPGRGRVSDPSSGTGAGRSGRDRGAAGARAAPTGRDRGSGRSSQAAPTGRTGASGRSSQEDGAARGKGDREVGRTPVAGKATSARRGGGTAGDRAGGSGSGDPAVAPDEAAARDPRGERRRGGS